MRVDSAGKLLLGLATGVVFGGLLQRGRASRYDVIMKQLLLRDGTVAKIMGTAVAVGAVGVHALVRAGKAKLDIKPLQLGGIVGGGVAFGTGLAVLGYCPGTSLAAIGEGRRDAIAGALGMLTGAAIFVRAYPALKPMIEAGDHGKVTLARPGRSPWPWGTAIGSTVALASLSDVAGPKSRGALGLLASLSR
jgi:uncharacterized membrane protein YedE/YeeE